jgi:K(+)-stimulated pyrophosphate-energized sodium pump
MMGITTLAPAADGMNAIVPVAVVKGTLNAEGDFVYDTGDIQEIKLSNKSLALGANSQMLALYNGLKLEDQKILDKSKWFTIENLYFQTGSSDLKAGSEEQLSNLAEILNAYPNSKVRLGGYTDNTGSEEGNLKLSNLRAQAAKLKLLEMGIAADRVDAEGYGSQHPVCAANDTDECKAQNRRIDVRVLNF